MVQGVCTNHVRGQNFGQYRPPPPYVDTLGPCTNHVDRILGNFDPPPPYVDTFTK